MSISLGNGFLYIYIYNKKCLVAGQLAAIGCDNNEPFSSNETLGKSLKAQLGIHAGGLFYLPRTCYSVQPVS